MEDPDRIDERRAPIKFRRVTWQEYRALSGACPRGLVLPGKN